MNFVEYRGGEGASPLKTYAPAHDDENNEYYEGDDDAFSCSNYKRVPGHAPR